MPVKLEAGLILFFIFHLDCHFLYSKKKEKYNFGNNNRMFKGPSER